MNRPPSQSSDPSEEQARSAARRFELRAVLVFVLAFVAAVLFAVVLYLVTRKSDFLLRFDTQAADRAHRFALRHKGFTNLMRFFSAIGTSVAWWMVFAVVIAWLARRRLRRLIVFVVVTALGSSLLNNLIKITVDRTRPHFADPVVVASGKSFPSGHAQAAIVGYGILLAVFMPVISRRARPWVVGVAAVMVLLIGYSRIALGVHFVSDVIGGYLVGLVWLLGLVAAFRTWRREEGKPAGPAADGLEPEQRDRLLGRDP
jgi:undecaprenyl-diphosphatase